MNGIVNLNTRVSELLDRMGVPDYTAGYSFLHTAIMSVYEQPREPRSSFLPRS